MQTYRINDIPREPASSHAVLASSPPPASCHGWQGLELLSHGGSPFIRSPDHDIRSLRPGLLQSGPHQLSTPLELIKHPRIGQQTPSSSAVTRLEAPTQLHNRFSVRRSRGQTPNPNLASPEEAEHSDVEGSGASEPLSIEALEYGWWAFEKNTGQSMEPKGKQLHQIYGYEYPELTLEQPGPFEESYEPVQSANSSPNYLRQSFAMDTRTELKTPYSALVSSPWSSSTTSQQTTSQIWSAASQASTFSEQSVGASPQCLGSMEHRTQNPIFNNSSWAAPVSGPLLSYKFSPDEDIEMSFTSSPEELISTQDTHRLWSSGNPPAAQHGIFENTYDSAVLQSQYTAENTHYIVGSGEAASGQNSASLNTQHYPMSTSVSSDFMSSACSATMFGQDQLIDHPISGMSPMLSERDTSIVVEDIPAVIVMSHLSGRRSDPSFSLPGTRTAMEKPRSSAKRTQRARQNSRIDAATSRKYGTLRCPIEGCTHESTGLSKNLNGHLERHMKTHWTKKMACPYPGCKTDFPLDRNDNLKAHCKRVHRNNW